MRNVRRVPFIIVSVANAILLVFMSMLYYLQISQLDNINNFRARDVLYIIIGLELVLVEPCLIYYIGKKNGIVVLRTYQLHCLGEIFPILIS